MNLIKYSMKTELHPIDSIFLYKISEIKALYIVQSYLRRLSHKFWQHYLYCK
jgi:hypothetical protein